MIRTAEKLFGHIKGMQMIASDAMRQRLPEIDFYMSLHYTAKRERRGYKEQYINQIPQYFKIQKNLSRI